MYPFVYHRPARISEAVDILRGAPDARAMAGGQSLLPVLKMRLAQVSALVDLVAVDELKGIRREDGALTVGAMTTHAEVGSSTAVEGAIPALAALARGIGDSAVRHRGTIGGSITFNDPAADYPAGLVGLGATVRTDRRTIRADDFFTGLFETALESDELVVSVSFPIPERASYVKFANYASRFAIVGVMVSLGHEGARVGVTGARACVFRMPELERPLSSSFSPEAIAGVQVTPDGLNADIHADAEYRAHLIPLLARRAVAACG